MEQRVKTHIPGFDKLIEGGFPTNSNIMISGGAGTGKTIFSLQYLYNGATIDKETGIYFTFEEKKESLYKQAKQFGWDLEKLEKQKKLKIISIGINDIEKSTIEDIISIIKSLKAKRVVIDSITTLSYLTPENNHENIITKYSIKKYLYTVLTKFKELKDITTIFISQKDEQIPNTIAEYICDGVIFIKSETMGGEFSRRINIEKMRRVKNNSDIHALEISNKGIVIHNIM